MKTGKEKIDLVIRAIVEVREIAPRGRHLTVDISAENGLESLRPDELELILLKLQDDEKILKIKSPPDYIIRPETIDLAFAEVLSDMGYIALGHFEIELLGSFDEWHAKYRARAKTITEGSFSTQQEEKEIPETETKYWIQFTSTREILLNDSHKIARPDFDRENEQVFGYLYNHPNEKFTKKQLEEELRTNLLKSLHKTVENLGFTGVLRKAFFNVSRYSIQFKNPIKSGDLPPNVLLELNSLIDKD